MRLIISNVSGIPIYEQIKEQIKSAIMSGELGDNDVLPSLRTLAKELKISVLTTTRAYTELENEGFVKNIQGKGCYVMNRGSELVREQLVHETKHNLIATILSAGKASLSRQDLHKLLDLLWEEKDG